MKIISKYILLVLILTSCSSVPEKNTFNANLTLIHTVDRQLEFEPCGCTFRPLGGIEREWNYTNGLRKEGKTLLYLVSGKTFYPMGSQFTKKQVTDYKVKAPFLMEAFQKLGVSLLAPSVDDVNLGEKFLKTEAAKYGIKLLSSNIQTKAGMPVFETSLEFNFKEAAVLVLSIQSKNSHTLDKKYTLENEEQAIKKVLELKTKNYFIILLSDLTEAQNANLVARFPQINMVLGSQEDSTPFYAFQLKKATVEAAVRGRGKSLLSSTFDLQLPINGLFSESLSKEMSANEKTWQNRLDKKEDVELMSSFLRQVATVPREYESGLSRYELQLVDLDDKLDSISETNPMHLINEKRKEKVRKVNMADE